MLSLDQSGYARTHNLRFQNLADIQYDPTFPQVNYTTLHRQKISATTNNCAGFANQGTYTNECHTSKKATQLAKPTQSSLPHMFRMRVPFLTLSHAWSRMHQQNCCHCYCFWVILRIFSVLFLDVPQFRNHESAFYACASVFLLRIQRIIGVFIYKNRTCA